jgi:D-alanyl-D-alanine carboxypeptidase
MKPDRLTRAVFAMAVAAFALACRSELPQQESASDPTAELTASLQALVDTAVADNESIHGAALYAAAPGLGFAFEGAAGLADLEAGTPMTPDRPVRTASNTKTYIAATALRLSEEGRLDLDDSISKHLSEELIAALHSDGYDPEAITIRHLLTHTAGVFDHSDTPNYIEAITTDPTHAWTRTEQVQSAMAWGDPLGDPGEVYRYSDTGYVLLGEIVANASGQPMATAVREMLDFERLGLGSTWWENLEPRPEGVPERAHQYFGEIDTYEFNPSLDLYGGGGLVATVGDMGRFMRALFTGGVYANPETAITMLSTIDGAEPSGQEGQMPPGMYRMGIWVLDVEGFETYRHSGFWGTVATYVSELDLVVAATVNQNQGGVTLYQITERSIALVAEASRSTKS